MYESTNTSLIVCASSDNVKPTITIWRHVQSSNTGVRPTLTMFVELMIKIFIMLAAVAILVHYIKVCE